MKRYRSFGIALLGLLLSTVMVPFRAQAQPSVEVSMQTFYDELDPYGQWIDDPEYGYVWAPEVADPDFRPYYTNGHWAMTEYGNMWVSDYDWGWAPFHYGRWAYTDYYGWVWAPDTTWGPAWVSWRTGGDYYGWAPLGPGISIDLYIGSRYSCPDFWWTFLPRRHLFSAGFYSYCSPFSRNVTIIHQTSFITNVYRRGNYRCIAGPSYREVGRYAGRVPMYRVNNVGRPGRYMVQHNRINVYRPSVNRSGSYRPSRMVSRDAYRQRNYDNRNNRNYRPDGRSGIADRNGDRGRDGNNGRSASGFNNRNNDGRNGQANNGNGRSSSASRPDRRYNGQASPNGSQRPNPGRQPNAGRSGEARDGQAQGAAEQRRRDAIRNGENNRVIQQRRQSSMDRRPETMGNSRTPQARPQRQATPQRQPLNRPQPQRNTSPQRTLPQRKSGNSRPAQQPRTERSQPQRQAQRSQQQPRTQQQPRAQRSTAPQQRSDGNHSGNSRPQRRNGRGG